VANGRWFEDRASPVRFGLRSVVRVGEREWPLSSISKVASESTNDGIGSNGQFDGFDADHVDLILRPSREVGYGTPTITKLWNRPIVIRDVKVDWKVPRDGEAKDKQDSEDER